MLAIFLRQDYPELARVVHSLSASVTTVFLFTRLWARATKYQGLWWDDYVLTAAWACQLVGNGLAAASPVYGFNVQSGTMHGQVLQFAGACFLYAAIGLSKTAFATTLVRLARGWVRAALWLVIAVVAAFTAALVVVTWLPLCTASFAMAALPGVACASARTVVWAHSAYALGMLAADVVLVLLPWRIVRGIRTIPSRERWKVALTMDLVGLAAVVEAARIALSLELPYNEPHTGMDYTYGIIAIYCLVQAEAAVFIIAQTIPIIRITLQTHSSASRVVTSVVEPRYSSSNNKNYYCNRQGEGIDKAQGLPASAPQPRPQSNLYEGVELVQLPTGRIVRADSEEGRALTASEASKAAAAVTAGTGTRTRVTPQPFAVVAAGGGGGEQSRPGEDEVHRLWADMGLSKRAWSRSPSPTRQQGREQDAGEM